MRMAQYLAVIIWFAAAGVFAADSCCSRAATAPADQSAINTLEVNPQVESGLEIVVEKNGRLCVLAGQGRDGERSWKTQGGVVEVAPAETVSVEGWPMTLVAGASQSWRGGNRLKIGGKDLRNLLPGSYVPGSLVVHDAENAARTYKAGRDYTMDEQWAAFAIQEGGGLKAGQEVFVDYRYSQRRIDALIVGINGKVQLLPGKPAIDCPEQPAVPDDALHLANVYRPFHADTLELWHVYVIEKHQPTPVPVTRTSMLGDVVHRLRGGRSVTIVCWGDSVTYGGDASSPDKTWVRVFEQLLNKRFELASIKVINAGIGGSNTGGRLPAFDKEVLSHRPDLITLEFVNDMGRPLEQLRPRYEEILKKSQAAGAALVIITPHFTIPEWMHLEHGRGAESREAVAFLREFCQKHKVPLVDVSQRWEALEAEGIPYETLLKNGINHPDDRGHRFFAEGLVRLLAGD